MEGFRIELVDERNLYDWQVAIFGPPGTLYEGGYFKAVIRFPGDYPFSPPTFKFVSRMWHPNVFSNGEVIFLKFIYTKKSLIMKDLFTEKC